MNMIKRNKTLGIDILFRVILLTLAGSFIYAMHSGIRNNYGIMLGSIVDNAGLSYASVSFVLAVGQFVFGLVQPAFGIVAAKRGNIYAVVSGVVLSVLGMVLTPLCKSTITLMICLGIILPAGSGAISYGIIMGTITPQIPNKTVSTVSGIVNASSGIGNTVLSPIINALIHAGGLMHCMLVLTVPIILTWPVSLIMEKKNTDTINASNTVILKTPAGEALDFKSLFQKAIRSRTYIFLTIGFFTCGFHMALITNHLPTHIQSFGFSSATTSYAFSIYGITTIIGSILSGTLCSRYKMKNVLGICYALRPITILAFLLLPKTIYTVTIFTALYGVSGAATVPPVSGLIDRAFGTKGLATLFGIVFLVHQIGGFFGAWLGGVCFDMTENYSLIWSVAIALGIIAAVVSFAITETKSKME